MQLLTKIKKSFNWSDLYLGIFLLPLIINPWGYTIYELPKVAFFRIFLSLVIVALIIKLFKNGKLTFHWNKYIYIFLGLWILSLLLSTVFSVAPNLSFFGSYSRLQGFLTHIFYIIYFILTLHFFQNKQNISKAFKFILFIGVLVSIYAILQKLGIDIYSVESKNLFIGRVFSTLGHPNFLGQFLLFPIWIGIILFLEMPKKKNIYYGIAILLLLLALFFTENRASILGLAVGLVIFSFIKIRFSKILKYILSTLAILVFIAFVVFIAPSSRSIQTRMLVWQNTPQIIAEHPVIGSGLETFKPVFQKVSPPEIYNYEALYETADRAHNEIIDITVTQGIFGILIYILVLISFLYLLFKKKSSLKDPAISIAFLTLVSTFIAKLFGFSLIVDWIILFTILAIFSSKLLKSNKLNIKKGISTIFISGVVTVLLIVNVFHVYTFVSADVYFKKGIFTFMSGNVVEGMDSMLNANKLNPNQDIISYLTASMFYILLKDTENVENLSEIEILTEQGGKFTNYDFRYNIELARLLAEQRKFDEAEELFKKAQSLAPNYSLLYKDWTYKYYLEKDYSNAIKKGEKFLEISPKYWQWKNDIENKTEEEKTQYRIFFKTAMGFWDIFTYLSKSYEKISDEDKASYYKQFAPVK